MNWNKCHLALRTLPFLDAHAGDPTGVLELCAPPSRRLLVWHPEAIEGIFRSDRQMQHMASRTLSPLLGRRSLLWAEGPRHAAYRRVLSPPLHGRQLKAWHGVISKTVHAAIDALVPGSVIPLPEWTRRVTFRIIAQIVLGRSDDAILAPFTAWIDKALGSRRRTLAYRYVRGGLPRSSEELDQLLVRSARATTKAARPTLAALLAEDGALGALGALDDEELRDQIVSLLFAGHETTASATAWTLYWLDRNESIRRDIISELAATADDGSDAAEVPLLHAAIQEALRLTPPVAVAGNRALTEEGELLRQSLAAGTILTPSIYLAHHRPDYFSNPHRFDPSRFLGNRVLPQHYFPFGGGVRHCLGSQLGQLETRMITAAVLRRRELRCVNPRAGIPQLRGHAMAPSSRLRMKVTACCG
jgi:cytochrome P450 family 110